MRRVKINYEVEPLFNLTGAELKPTARHFLATETALSHLHGLMGLLSFVGDGENFQPVESANMTTLTESLRAVGELGAAIAEQGGEQLKEFGDAFNRRLHDAAEEAMFAEREQAERRKEFAERQSTESEEGGAR